MKTLAAICSDQRGIETVVSNITSFLSAQASSVGGS